MNHNRFFRLSALAGEIIARGDTSGYSVLDVGGGQGELASFIPGADYCLAEPAASGMSGESLPFSDGAFDYVVSCHVLEHIPLPGRERFLDELMAKARRGVILLNPFYVQGTRVRERLELFIEVTGAAWAQEHLDCTLPRVEDVTGYAAAHGLECAVKPNGTLAVSAAFVFLDHFAKNANLGAELRKINVFFNRDISPILDSPDYPNAYLIYLGWPPNGAKTPSRDIDTAAQAVAA